MLQVQRSMAPLTEFAPTWQIPFWITRYDNMDNLDYMRDWIIDNEDRIISEYAHKSRNDGGTGLGLNSLTAQYNTFNLFRETRGLEPFEDYFKFLRVEYETYMREYKTEIRACTMYAWANVVRTGQTIKKHHHGASHYAYLSGNMHFSDYETITRYHNPYAEMYYDCTNQKGGVTFFPSYIFHETTQHEQDVKRVSMAFDLYDRAHMEGHDNNSVEF